MSVRKIIEVQEDGVLRMPEELSGLVRMKDRFAVITQGGDILLKKVEFSKATEIADRAIDDGEMSIDEVNAEVHAYREEKKRGQ